MSNSQWLTKSVIDAEWLVAEYVAYVANLRDSGDHKRYLLSNDKCFAEWVEEHYPEHLDKI